MRMVQIRSERWPGVRAGYARSFRERLSGMKAGDSTGALLIAAKSVHTYGLGRPIQLVALDEDLRVLESRRVAPGRVTYFRRASSILELSEHESLPPVGSMLEVTDA